MERQTTKRWCPGYGDNYVGNLLDLHPIAATLGAAGKAAKDLEKVGTSVEGQRLGAAVMGAVSTLGVRGVKLSTREVKDYLRKKFGANWSKRLTAEELDAVNDHLMGQGLESGAQAGIDKLYSIKQKDKDD